MKESLAVLRDEMRATAMSSAMRAAGIVPVEERLAEAVRAAVGANPKRYDAARDALQAAVRRDPEVLWMIFAPRWWNAAAQELLSAEYATQREAGGGQQVSENHAHGAPADSSDVRGGAVVGMLPGSGMPPATSERGGGQMAADQVRRLPAPSARPTAARGNAGMASVGEVARLSLLDTVYINNRALGDVTASEARKWAETHSFKARFVLLLIANLPPDKPIREFVRAEDADEMWKRAEELQNVA